MKKSALIVAVLISLGSRAAAAITAGDHQFALNGGVSKAVGATEQLSNTGFSAGFDYLYYPWNGSIGLGIDAGFTKLPDRPRDAESQGFATRLNNNPRFASVAAMARFNLMPESGWTPFLTMGLGTAYNGNRLNARASTPRGDVTFTTKDNFWRITGLLGAGADWFIGNGFLGTQVRFQTLNKATNSVTGSVRIGHKF